MASSLIAKTIFFIVTILLSLIIAYQFTTMIAEHESALRSQQDLLSSKFASRMQIESFSYDFFTNNVTLYIRNIGNDQIGVTDLSVYLNSSRISKNDSFYANITEDTNTLNSKVWDPKEIVIIQFTYVLDENASYLVLVTDSYGNAATITKQPVAVLN